MDMNRIMGVITLKAPIYREIADDPNATTPAAIITAVVGLIAGFFQGLVSLNPQTGAVSANVTGAVISAIIIVILTLIAWFVSAWVLAFVAKWFGGKTNTQEMLRVTGYVNIFGLVAILTVLALITPALGCIAGLIGFVIAILRLIGYIIGVREAAEFSTGNAIITAIIAAIINFLIVAVVGGVIAGAIGLGALAAGAQ
jgi:hypothetical protein